MTIENFEGEGENYGEGTPSKFTGNSAVDVIDALESESDQIGEFDSDIDSILCVTLGLKIYGEQISSNYSKDKKVMHRELTYKSGSIRRLKIQDDEAGNLNGLSEIYFGKYIDFIYGGEKPIFLKISYNKDCEPYVAKILTQHELLELYENPEKLHVGQCLTDKTSTIKQVLIERYGYSENDL